MAEKMPNKQNQTSFSSTHQPASRVGENNRKDLPAAQGRPPRHTGPGRPKGRRNKRTEAQDAFAEMGYNPSQAQVALVMQLKEILEAGIDDDGKTLTMTKKVQLIRQIAEINDKLMQYQSSKAAPEVEEYLAGNDEDFEDLGEIQRPLTAKELMDSRKMMSTKKGLEERFGS